MTAEKARRIRLIYGIVLSVMLVISGICLIAACLGIYRSGDHPFTRQVVAERFAGICIPIYICLVLIVGGFILDFLLPLEKQKLTAVQQNALILRRLHERNDLSGCGEALRKDIQTQQKRRKLHWSISIVLLAAGSVVFLIYALDGSHFHSSQITQSVISAMYVMLPCLGIPFLYSVFSAFYSRASMGKEIALVKQAIAEGCPRKEAKKIEPKKPGKGVRVLRLALICVAVGILLYGFFAGGTVDVLTKAVNICTECVGLG